MFKSLCGLEAMPNVVIAMTMWSEVRQNRGEEQEAELKKVNWKTLLNKCRIKRFLGTYDSAWNIINYYKRHQVNVQVF